MYDSNLFIEIFEILNDSPVSAIPLERSNVKT